MSASKCVVFKKGAAGTVEGIDWEQVANGILIVITGILGYFGIRKGFAGSAPAGNASIAVAGAMIDDKKADEIIEAINHNTAAIEKMNANFEAQAMEEEIERRAEERAKQLLGRSGGPG